MVFWLPLIIDWPEQVPTAVLPTPVLNFKEQNPRATFWILSLSLKASKPTATLEKGEAPRERAPVPTETLFSPRTLQIIAQLPIAVLHLPIVFAVND
jgi:hypothetical protein